jgi:hypothetical protein
VPWEAEVDGTNTGPRAARPGATRSSIAKLCHHTTFARVDRHPSIGHGHLYGVTSERHDRDGLGTIVTANRWSNLERLHAAVIYSVLEGLVHGFSQTP